MSRIVPTLVALAACLLASGCEFADEPAPRAEDMPSAIAPKLQAANADAAELYRVVETYFNAYLALNPIYATALGDHRFDDRFGDYASASWMADSLGIAQEALERLAAVDPKRLQGEDLVTYQAFRQQCEADIYGYRYPSELLAIDPIVNWATTFAELASGDGVHPFRTTADYDHFLSRMDGFVAWTEQAINNLRSGVSKGVVLPRSVVERTLPQLVQFASIEDPRQSVFWRPLLNFPAGPTVADRRRLLEAYERKLRTQVIPAYRRLHDYLATEYLPHTRETIAWSDLPSGDFWYAWRVRYYTNSDLTPAEVHELGLREVARLRANLANLQPALGVAGDARALFDAVRADPKFVATDARATLHAFEALQARVAAQAQTLFPRVPKTGLRVRPLDPGHVDAATAVVYQRATVDGARPAILYIDTSALAPYLIESTYLREGMPGRHFRTSRSQEAETLPSVRRFGPAPPLDGGWALYAQTLGGSLGLYQEPWSQFGAIATELQYSAALVVDTGIHAQGWNRQRAVEYLRANTVLGESEIQAEVDRYVARAAEAFAYKTGELKLLEMRRNAEQRLGARFDLRQFHEQVIGAGAVPLPALAAKLDRWIATQRQD